ncbi:MAG TPA: hypothetical protein VG323_18985 [Thermoanaerobaculia bacterium]|nr:hypothetical protein [Thermoanaerobaculia bacterium]
MRRTILLLALLALSTGAAWRRGDAYILHRGNEQVAMMSSTIEQMNGLMRRLGHEPYFWARIDGREWVIRDEAFLREAVALWAPVRELKPEEKALNAEERQLDKRIDAIEDHPRTAAPAPGELDQLRARYRDVEQRLRELDHRMEAREKVAEETLRDLVDAAIRDGRAKSITP